MRKLRILFSLFVIMLLAAPFSYGAKQSFGDGKIEVDMPDGWQVVDEADYESVVRAVCGCTQETAAGYMEYFHSIMMAEDPSADPKAMMQLLYTTEYEEDRQADFNEYSREELEDFCRDEDGKTVLQDAILFLTFGAPEIGDEFEVLSTDWGNFIHAQVRERTDSPGAYIYHQVYFTMRDSAVITFCLTTNGPPAKKSLQDMESAVTSFSDSGWYDSYTVYGEDDGDYEDYDYGTDGDVWTSFIVIAIILVIGGGLAAQKKRGMSSSRMRRAASNKGQGGGQQQSDRSMDRHTAFSSSETEKKGRIKIPKMKSVKADGKMVQVRNESTGRAKTPDESYMESLRTLLDSGLLTKEEYQDMIEAHNRNKRI
ncbi:hypothetical protein NE619_15480 [Anaerovorax odorimutans]|uniref:SHOCT domain-containing protein n=1 Tax=Anaerovorax odorimutans TaxID=109327 RepID=A0ABT1RSG5_9FIRM|nr:hypothetical protein [Anaerovorax odorimutans]MCQ4638136.1 hypothetical protein [Anaerovorax odorimutans]